MATTRIQFRQDVKENWDKFNPKLFNGEPALDLTTRRMKIGDGFHDWKNLPYMKIGSQLFDLYVSTEGNDTWSGDDGAPLRTLGAAVTVANDKFSYTMENVIPTEVSENYLEFYADADKVFVGDYFTSDVGNGFVVDYQDGKALVGGSFTVDSLWQLAYCNVSRRCTIHCDGSVMLESDLYLPPFVEIVNDGFLYVNGTFNLCEHSIFSFINRGSVFCANESVFLKSEKVAKSVNLILGISEGVTIDVNAFHLAVKDTLTPSECNVHGTIGFLEMSGVFTSHLDADCDSAVFEGNYTLSGKVEGSVSLNGMCHIDEELTIGEEGKTSVILCPVVGGNLSKVGSVKDINTL